MIILMNISSPCPFGGLEGGGYLSSVGTDQAEFNDEDRLRGDDGVRGGVGRRGDHWVRAALSCHQSTEQRSASDHQ